MHSKPLEPHELDKIATATLAHYEQHAEEFLARHGRSRRQPEHCLAIAPYRR
jgi:hypothetical protein